MYSGSTSGIDRQRGVVLIKASGMDYDCMWSEDMVVTDLEGRNPKGKWNPSGDLPGHSCIYKHCQEVGVKMRSLCPRDVRPESGDVAYF
jgi:L-ribulose-5-phosphate 4-epimerase